MSGALPRLVAGLALFVLAGASVAEAQARRSELGVELPFAGVSNRDLGYVATRNPLRPGFGLGLRVLGRVARAERFELHLGARLSATAWRTDTLRRTEGAFRTTFDPGLALRGARGPLALVLTVGPTFALPAFAELFSGVRTARGAHFELALGFDHGFRRLRTGVELAYVHHRLRESTPVALTTTHLVALRVLVGVAAAE
ncbi:MAG: hypothetical protein R3B99_34290 [Polyangiales bacterium]